MIRFSFTFFTLIIFQFSFSQEVNLVRPIEVNSNSTLSSLDAKEKTNSVNNAVTTTYLVKNKEYYTEFIEALSIKKEVISNDSTLHVKATQLNWYSKIDEEIKKAKQQIEIINQNEK